MRLTKCVNGHFYDEEKYSSCPQCSGAISMDREMDFRGAGGLDLRGKEERFLHKGWHEEMWDGIKVIVDWSRDNQEEQK